VQKRLPLDDLNAHLAVNIPPFQRRSRFSFHSFTLVELLVVIAIASIMVTMSVAAYAQITRSMTLTIGGQMLTGSLDMARQTAITRNSTVEFRIYQLPDYSASPTSTPVLYRAFQTFLITPNATNALTPVTFLPAPAIISVNTTVSSLATVSPVQETQSIPNYGQNYNALVFDFLPAGGTNLDSTSSWYMTILIRNDPIVGNNLPKNFVTIQIDPFSGRVKTYRP